MQEQPVLRQRLAGAAEGPQAHGLRGMETPAASAQLTPLLLSQVPLLLIPPHL